MRTVLSSRSKQVTIGADQPFCIIGERINPTGRKAFAEALRAGVRDRQGRRRPGHDGRARARREHGRTAHR